MNWLEPFQYSYMVDAIVISALVGGVCAFLSAFLMLKGWALIGDALSHAIVPGVAGAAILGLPFSLGAFFAGGLAALSMLFLHRESGLKEDAIIGVLYTSFFGFGLFMASLWPLAINVQTIMLGNILAITPADKMQLLLIVGVSLLVLVLKWADLMVSFFDESHAYSVGVNPSLMRIVFFTLLAVCTVAAMQTVGAFLVVAMVVTPGATAYLLCDRFPRLIQTSVAIGAISGLIGAYASYFFDGATGGIVVLVQTMLFGLAFLFAPKHGLLAARRLARTPQLKCTS